MADFGTILEPSNDTLNLYCKSITSGPASGGIIYPNSLHVVVANSNPQPFNLDFHGFSGGRAVMTLDQSAYFSLYGGHYTLTNGTDTDISPIGYQSKQLNTLGYVDGTGILTIGITGYYKINFAATLNIQATTAFTSVNKIGVGLTGLGIALFSTLSSVPSVASVQVIPISNSAIIKLTAGFGFSLQATMSIDKDISMTDISWDIVLIDSVSP